MVSGPDLILLSMPLIMLRLDNMLTNNAFGTKNHCLKVELSEQNVTLKSSFLITHWAILTSLIHQKNPSHFAHWRTSHIKLNTQSNGPETILKESSQNHPPNCKSSTMITSRPWLNLKNNTSKTLQLWDQSSKLWRDFIKPTKKNHMPLAFNWLLTFSKMPSTIKSPSCLMHSQPTTSLKIPKSHSGVDWKELLKFWNFQLMIPYIWN